MPKFRTTSYLTVRLKRIHEIEADVMATSYREAREQFTKLFPLDHVVEVRRAPTVRAA